VTCDIVGELSFIDGGGRVAGVTTLEPVRVLVVPSSRFRGHLERTARVAVLLLSVLSWRFPAATVKRSEFTAAYTTGSLAAGLLELTERYGCRREEGIEIELGISEDELAAWTGASGAGVAKALQALRELGWIETHRGRSWCSSRARCTSGRFR
jgi:CRP/FNR family transcriptional regulator, cyclic AMP receptor protein